jgi:hypothetical protein
MENLFDLRIYLKCLMSIQNGLGVNPTDSACLSQSLNTLQNYFEQINSVEQSVIFSEEFQNESNYYCKDKLKKRILFKLNNYLNEEFEMVYLKL